MAPNTNGIEDRGKHVWEVLYSFVYAFSLPRCFPSSYRNFWLNKYKLTLNNAILWNGQNICKDLQGVKSCEKAKGRTVWIVCGHTVKKEKMRIYVCICLHGRRRSLNDKLKKLAGMITCSGDKDHGGKGRREWSLSLAIFLYYFDFWPDYIAKSNY